MPWNGKVREPYEGCGEDYVLRRGLLVTKRGLIETLKCMLADRYGGRS